MQTLFDDDDKKKPSAPEKPAAVPSRASWSDSVYSKDDEDLKLPLDQPRQFKKPLSSLDPPPFFHVRRPRTRRMGRKLAFYSLLVLSGIFGTLVGLMLVYSMDLPQMRDLERYRPNTTTQLLDVKGRPFGSFALERRVVVPYDEFPPVLKQAIFSIEDKSFEQNAGINPFRAVGAAIRDMRTHGRKQGASTLTMQLARNLFLSAEQTWRRKVQEVFLTIQIERHFTKEQIFALYANQIYLGSGTYGFEAGSEYYFSKHVRELTLPEAALLAALPKGPESYSPVRHPERALRRRNLVLSEMRSDGRITEMEYQSAKATPLGLHIESPANSLAPYFVEEVRRQLEQQYGSEQVHGAGLRIYTSLDLDLQMVANKAVLDGLAAYERRHGWKGHLQNIYASGTDVESYRHPDWTQPIEDGAYLHALVTEVSSKRVAVRVGKQELAIAPASWMWTRATKIEEILTPGDIAYIRVTDAKAKEPVAALEQDSGAQGALMAVDNANGEVLALVGGRDFALSQFNRATQAERQVGSSFKPYVYTAAIEHGAKPSDIVLDVPTSFYTPNGPYTPHNYEADYKGAMTLTMAFAESRNIPALRLANGVGILKVIEVAHRFGITSNIPAFLPVAIGSASISLYEQVGAYSVFPNDGIRIEPHYIRRVLQADGLPLQQVSPQVKEVISVATARTMMKLLEAVPQYGTAAQAGAVLKHPLGGKTGTTNDYTDAWFLGFSPSVTCGTWVGYDDRKTLGEKETGARAALPMWIDFMKAAIARTPVESFPADNAPKKALEVPINTAPNQALPKKPVKADDADESDSDNDESGAKKPAAPASAPPLPVTNATPADEPATPVKTPPPAKAPAAPAVRQAPAVPVERRQPSAAPAKSSATPSRPPAA